MQKEVRRLRADGPIAHAMACVSGAFVSPMQAKVIGMQVLRCPYRRHTAATKEQLWWSCGVASLQNRRPVDPIEAQLGWREVW